MANILVTTLPAYPFAFFRIIHHKTSSPVTALPYRPVYDSTGLAAVLSYLNGTYKTGNGFLGTFYQSGSAIMYTTHPSESYSSGLFEVMLLTKLFRLHVNNPPSFGISGEFYFWNWGIVIDWGDGTWNGYRDGIPENQLRDRPSHVYSSGSQRIDVFHEDNFAVFLCRDPALKAITGEVSTELHTVAITNSQIQLLDMELLLRPAMNTVHLVEFRNTSQLRLFGVTRPWVKLQAFNFRYCNFSRAEVDRMLREVYLLALACPPVRERRVDVYAEQSPAAPPTDATRGIRRIMQEEWGWWLFLDN